MSHEPESQLQPEPQRVLHSVALREVGVRPERLGLIEWYQEQLASFGEVLLEPVNATDGQNWKGVLDGTEVEKITGAFFEVRGSRVNVLNRDGTAKASWNQPGIHQGEVELIMPTSGGEQRVMTSGFVGIIRDEANNVLLTLGQEPYARTPKNVLLKTPFQTSATKFKALLDGDRAKDPNFYDLLVTLGGNEDIRAFFGSERVDAFPLPYADANRIDATNYGFAVVITDGDLRETLKNGERNRWCTPAEVREVMRAGLLNGHTAAGIFASTSLVR